MQLSTNKRIKYSLVIQRNIIHKRTTTDTPNNTHRSQRHNVPMKTAKIKRAPNVGFHKIQEQTQLTHDDRESERWLPCGIEKY